MEKSIKRGNPEKSHMDHESSPYMGNSNSDCAREPAHAESAEDAIENFHGTNGSQTKLPMAGRMFTTPQSPIIAAKKLTR